MFRLFLTSLNFAMMVGLWNEFLVTKSPGQFRCWSPKNGSLEAFLQNHLANFEGFPWKKQQTPLEESGTTRATRVNWQDDFFARRPSSFASGAPGGCPCHPCVWAASVQPPASATMRANSAFMWLDLWWVRCQEWPEQITAWRGERGDKKYNICTKVCVIWLYSVCILLHTWCEFIYCTYLYALTKREEAQLYK